jgi:hypothetical protein
VRLFAGDLKHADVSDARGVPDGAQGLACGDGRADDVTPLLLGCGASFRYSLDLRERRHLQGGEAGAQVGDRRREAIGLGVPLDAAEVLLAGLADRDLLAEDFLLGVGSGERCGLHGVPFVAGHLVSQLTTRRAVVK